MSVETIGSGSGTEPWKITGSLNGEEISIRLPNQNPGNYPFRINGTNPAILLSFTGELFESSHRIKWSTADETDLASFSIEASGDGINFTTVATVNPTGSNSSYQVVFANNVSAGVARYYRLKTTDTDGRTRYSSIVKIGDSFTVSYKPPGDVARAGYDGNLEISANDKTKRVVTGRFYFKIKTAAGQLYTISNGEFRASY